MPILVDEPPERGEWVHEVKYDGYRTQFIIEGGQARAFTRRGFDWTDRFRLVADASARLACRSAILDGEMIVTGTEGKPDFRSLRAAITSNPGSLIFVAFDLLHLDRRDLRRLPLLERKRLLWELIGPAEGKIQYSEHVESDAAAFFRAVDAMGLEGMVSKRPDSAYRSGPNRNWLKIKCYEETDLEIAGVLRERGNAPLALMATRDGERKYVGSAIIALNDKMRERLWKLVQAAPGRAPKGVKKAAAQWTGTGLVGRVRHMKGEEKLRHATLTEIRSVVGGKLDRVED